MASNKPLLEFTTPTGRFVQGDLNIPDEKDRSGRPLLTRDGKPRKRFYMAIAIRKVGNGHWAVNPYGQGQPDPTTSTPGKPRAYWGEAVWNFGHQVAPNLAGLPKFAWKVIDGDSTELNEAGRRWCDYEGFAGCWVLKLSNGFAPAVYDDKEVRQTNPDFCYPGCYVQVFVTCASNEQSDKPGLFMNHAMVCVRGFAERIVSAGVDVSKAGFGGGTLPAGVSAVPMAGAMPPAPAAAPNTYAPAAPPVPGYVPAAGAMPAPGMGSVPGAVGIPGSVLVHPAPQFVQHAAGAPAAPMPPPMPVPPAAAPVAPQPPARTMLNKGGQVYDYAGMIAAGWTDAGLIAEGYMAP